MWRRIENIPPIGWNDIPDDGTLPFVVEVAADTTPPTLIVPVGVAADATSASGAVVVFDVSATDRVDPAPIVTCTPASGALFPIGETTVTCTATDASGNVATASFVAHVRGAAEQLTLLRRRSASLGLRPLVARSLDLSCEWHRLRSRTDSRNWPVRPSVTSLPRCGVLPAT